LTKKVPPPFAEPSFLITFHLFFAKQIIHVRRVGKFAASLLDILELGYRSPLTFAESFEITSAM
jgi:hypothetical protein